jgi:hypothetical protein
MSKSHGCSADHEHFSPDPDGTQLFVEASERNE